MDMQKSLCLFSPDDRDCHSPMTVFVAAVMAWDEELLFTAFYTKLDLNLSPASDSTFDLRW